MIFPHLLLESSFLEIHRIQIGWEVGTSVGSQLTSDDILKLETMSHLTEANSTAVGSLAVKNCAVSS